MRRGLTFVASSLTLMLPVLVLASAAGVLGDDGRPRRLHAHPDRDLANDAGPYWIAASVAFKDDAVQKGWRIGEERASVLAETMPWESRLNDTDDCQVTPKEAEGRRALMLMPVRTVYLPGDFTGWVAASEAVVVATVTDLVPGFDAVGKPNTLVVLGDVDHLYPSSEYPYRVRYVILPYAQFVAGGRVFCSPWAVSLEYYPAVGDRLLIAADSPRITRAWL